MPLTFPKKTTTAVSAPAPVAAAAPAPVQAAPVAGRSVFAGIENEKSAAPRNYLKPGVYRLKIAEIKNVTGYHSGAEFLAIAAEVLTAQPGSQTMPGESVNIVISLAHNPKYNVNYGFRDAKSLVVALSGGTIAADDVDSNLMESVVGPEQPCRGHEVLVTAQDTGKTTKKGDPITSYRYASAQ